MMTRSRAKMEAKRKRIEEEERYLLLEEVSSDLLPGILNSITLQVICTMLPWETFHVLSSVSHAWQQAVQRRQIHDARIRTRSTDTLAVINHTLAPFINAISLYSLRDKACYRLPRIPQVGNSIPWDCGCITLDGKIYILGGLMRRDRTYTKRLWRRICKKDVYVLDVVGQRQWKKCASMLAARYAFGCGVLDGKIYVCGGICLDGHARGAEVYDPKIDAWRSIQPMRSFRAFHEVGKVGEELLVYGGCRR